MLIGDHAKWLKDNLDLEKETINLVHCTMSDRVNEIKKYGLRLPGEHEGQRALGGEDAIYCMVPTEEKPNGFFYMTGHVPVKFETSISNVNIKPHGHRAVESIPLRSYLMTDPGVYPWRSDEPVNYEFLVLENVPANKLKIGECE